MILSGYKEKMIGGRDGPSSKRKSPDCCPTVQGFIRR
jgi:hypothetical protein